MSPGITSGQGVRVRAGRGGGWGWRRRWWVGEAEEVGVKEGMGEEGGKEGDAARFREQQGRRL